MAAQLGVAPRLVHVRTYDRPAVPGLTVFEASVDRQDADRGRGLSGVFDGTTITTEAAAMTKIARAWRYGPQRTASASEVARVFGMLHSAEDSASPMIDEETVEEFKALARPAQAAVVHAPQERMIDGLPAVTYFINSDSRALPLSEVTAIVHPDFSVELRTRRVPKE